MPNIREVTSKVDGLTPSDRGVSGLETAASSSSQLATARAIAAGHIQQSWNETGRLVGGAISQVGNAYVDHLRTTQGINALKDTSNLALNAQVSWSQDLADASSQDIINPNMAADHLQKLSDGLDAIRATLTTKEGQQLFDQQRIAIEQHFKEATIADMSTLVGKKALRDVQASGLSNQSLAYKGPADASLARGLSENSRQMAIASLGSNATPENIDALNQHFDLQRVAITVAEGRGAIDAAPDPKAAAAQFLASPEATTLLTDTQRESIRNHAEQVAKAVETDTRQAQADAARQEREQASTAANQLLGGVQYDATGKATLPANFFMRAISLAQLPGADPSLARAIVNWGQGELDRATGTDAKTDPDTYTDFSQRAALPQGDRRALTATEVLRARQAGTLDNADFKHFIGQVVGDQAPTIADKQFRDSLDSFKGFITTSSPLLGTKNPQQDQRWGEFQRDADQYRRWALSKGATEEAILNDLRNSIPRYQVGKEATRSAARSLLRGAISPLPPVQGAPVPGTKRSTPAQTSAERMKELDRIANGG